MDKQFDLVGLRATENEATYVLQFTGGSGELLEVEVPADNFLGIFPQLQQLWIAASIRRRVGTMTKRGAWEQTPLVEPHTVHVESVSMLSPPQVALVVDRGLPTQLGYQFAPDQAQELAARLLAKAAECSHQTPKH